MYQLIKCASLCRLTLYDQEGAQIVNAFSHLFLGQHVIHLFICVISLGHMHYYTGIICIFHFPGTALNPTGVC